MKKLWIYFAGALIVASCSTAEKSPADIPANTGSPVSEEAADIQRAKKETIDSINMATIRQRTIDSMTRVEAERDAMTRPAVAHHAAHHAPAANNNPAVTSPAPVSAPATQANNSSNSTRPATTAATPEKKGLSNGIKGGLIGLGTGAAAGAIIDKNNRGEGAIIGGVVGAVGGAFGGALIDRSKRKKAAEQAHRDSLRTDSINRANGR